MDKAQKPLIRQGWLRALLYFIGISVIAFIFSFYGSVIGGRINAATESGNDSVVNFGILYALMGLLIFLFTWLMRRFVDRKSFESLGFTWKSYTNEAALGFFAALALMGLGSLVLVAIGYLSFISASFSPGALFFEIVFMAVVAFVEELLFRGYLLNNLMQSMNKWVALIVSAVLFGLFHISNPDVSIFAVANILIAGLLLGVNYIFTKNLWFGIFFHFAWNYFQGPVLGFEVSGLKLTGILQQTLNGPALWTGGAFGFEGSLLCPLLLAVAVLIFTYQFSKRYSQPL